jgi:aminoglycoside phosphotransferase (APT) family kinase protein
MPRNIQLLKQVRNAATTINATTENPEYKALLAGVDVALNELMLQDNADFYLQYIERGRLLVDQGRALLKRLDISVPPLFSDSRKSVHANLRSDVLHEEMDRLQQDLSLLTSHLDEGNSAEEKTFLIDVCDWQASLLLHRQNNAAASVQEPIRQITADALLAYLQKKFSQWKDLSITRFVSLDGGFSKKTIMFETQDAMNGVQSMVIRAEQPIELLTYAGSDVTQEFHSIRLMQKNGLPTAEPLWLEDDQSQLGWRFIVSRKSQGRSYGGNLGSNEVLNREQIESIVAGLVKMHSIRLDAKDPLAQKSHFREWLPFKTITDSIHYQVTDFTDNMIRQAAVMVTPQMMRGMKWLRANIPEVDEPPVIVHIDYALNNLLLDEHGVKAILDWESSRFGDPADDLVWTQDNLREYLSMPELLEMYRSATRREVSEYRLAYARVSRLVTNLIVFQRCLEAIDKYDATNINLCILGIKYPGYFASHLNTLIADAEQAKSR